MPPGIDTPGGACFGGAFTAVGVPRSGLVAFVVALEANSGGGRLTGGGCPGTGCGELGRGSNDRIVTTDASALPTGNVGAGGLGFGPLGNSGALGFALAFGALGGADLEVTPA